MYCQHCGAESTPELNYCKRCGKSLVSSTSMTEQPARSGISSEAAMALGFTTTLTCVGGLAVIFAFAAKLASLGVNSTALAWMVIVSTLMIFGVISVFIGQFTNLLGTSRPTQDSRELKKAAPKELDMPRAQALPLPASSVTDHTTRIFEPSYKEPSA